MPDDTRAIPATEQRNQDRTEPAYKAARFEVPEFMVPKSIAEVRELARMIALAEWAPDSYRDIEGNYILQKIELTIMHGATVGLSPIAAVQSIAIIEGMPTIWGDGALALVERSGLLEDMLEEYLFDEEEGLTAICTMTRRRRPTPITNRFSFAMAEHARLTQKEGPWQTYPQRMLRMRARSWTIRDGFADVLRGLQVREEVDDFIEIRSIRPALPNCAPGTSRGTLGRNAEPHRGRPASQLKSAVNPLPAAIAQVDSQRSDGPQAEPPEAAAAKQETFTLVAADGSFIEVVGAEALRGEFERLLFDKHLSPDQVVGLWESNDQARDAIRRLFDETALDAAAERLKSADIARKEQREEHQRRAQGQQSQPGSKKERAPECARRVPPRTKGPAAQQSSATDLGLVVTIDPTWGDQKVFRHYRARLAALRNAGSVDAPDIDITRFREANGAIEARLRSKLPQLMREIDALSEGPDPALVGIEANAEMQPGPDA